MSAISWTHRTRESRVAGLSRRAWMVYALHGALLTLTIVLLTVNLTTWPRTWFDEGLNAGTAAMLSEHHVYGLPDSEGIRKMDPAIQTGPAVIVPLALAFELFGVGLLQARIVMVVFGVFALAMLYLLARRLNGMAPALLAVGLLLMGNGDWVTSFVPMSRQVLGEVPAIGFVCLGCWVWIRGIHASQRLLLASLLAGALLGMAMTTKSQIAVTLPVALIALWVANIAHYRATRWWSPLVVLVVSAGCMLAWQGAQIAYVGQSQYQANSEVLRSGFSIHIATLSIRGPLQAIQELLRIGFPLWGAPGILYGYYLARNRTKESFCHAILLALLTAWLAWFVMLSIGWPRYSFIPAVFTTIYAARLVADIVTGSLRLPFIPSGPALRTLLAAVMLVSFVWHSAFVVEGVFGRQNTDLNELAHYLDEHVPHDVVIESWSWEMDLLTGHAYHHPGTQVTNDYTVALYRDQPLPEGIYDVGQAKPSYVLDGPWSSWTTIYKDYISEHAIESVRFGDHTLHRVR